MIEAVVFDYGGVLSQSLFVPLAELERDLALPAGALVDALKSGTALADAELGRRGVVECFEEWCAQVEAEHGVALDRGRLGMALAPGIVVNEDTLDLVARLAGRYRLAILTNNIAEIGDRWRSLVPLELFDVVVASCDVGLRKPDPAIYRLVLDELGLEGPQVAFVDDTQENMAAAAGLGIHTVLFADAAQVEADLVALGVTPAPRPA